METKDVLFLAPKNYDLELFLKILWKGVFRRCLIRGRTG